jgi:sulfotransferase family protein
VPVFEQQVMIIARSVRAFLNLQAGVTRSEIVPPWLAQADQNRGLEEARRELAGKDRELDETRRQLAELQSRLADGDAGTQTGSVKPENIVWIFGSPKTGSTWLSWMMEELEGHAVWREPYVGQLFGRLYHNWVGERHFESKHFILGGPQKESWLNSVRSFVLSEANARFPEVANGGYLVVKEPNGSLGAPLLMEALPESRMIFLIRDPRDVAASHVDSSRKGSYMYERRKGGKQAARFEMQADDLVNDMATKYLQNVGNAKKAYDAHKGPKVLVRYEELRSDTLGTMKRIYSTLGIGVDQAQLEQVVNKHSWENIPEDQKGQGKFYRKATPGGWREDLTPEQAEIIEKVTAPLLKEFYPD